MTEINPLAGSTIMEDFMSRRRPAPSPGMSLVFDRCPECGAPPRFGLRCHPKWSVKVGVTLVDGTPDLQAFYAHDQAGIEVLAQALSQAGHHVMEIECWSEEAGRWLEMLS